MMFAWQRTILRADALQAYAIFVSTKLWVPQLYFVSSLITLTILPVGSNIPRSFLSKEEPRRHLGISDGSLVLGIFGEALPSRSIDWVAEAARVVQSIHMDLLVLHVGPEGDIIKQSLCGLPFKTLGLNAPHDASDAMRFIDCLVYPFVDGVSLRRGSAMAALNNDIPVATTRSALTDDFFLDAGSSIALASKAQSLAEFASYFAMWCRTISATKLELIQPIYDERFAWAKIPQTMVKQLRDL